MLAIGILSPFLVIIGIGIWYLVKVRPKYQPPVCRRINDDEELIYDPFDTGLRFKDELV